MGCSFEIVARKFVARCVPHESGCTLYMGGVDRKGYGRSMLRGRRIGAHRLAWIIANGPVPDGLHVLHRCDVRRCVNVGHLFLGTNKDNVDDMIRKGRHWRGRLSDDDVRAIRAACAAGEWQRIVGERYGIKQQYVSRIVSRHNRKICPPYAQDTA